MPRPDDSPLDPAAAAARRSFVYRELQGAGAVFAAVGDAAVAAHFNDADEDARAARLGLADLSPLPRTGFKGPETADWLKAQGVAVGAESNRAWPCGRGSLAARLAPGEVLVLGDRFGRDDLCARLDAAWGAGAKGTWPVPRRDSVCWFHVSGEKAAAMFAKLCGVDLKPASFAPHAVAQTSIARLNGIVIRDDLGQTPACHLLADSASAGYLWEVLGDAAAEFDGGPVGLDALRRLAGANA